MTKFKELIDKSYSDLGCFGRLIGTEKKNVGMCGDGANDLMAIREADVGIGINDSDASYAASFTIIEMLDVDYIIRESKCTSVNIIEMFRYYATISFIKIPCSLLLMSDTTYWNGLQLIYFNFTSTVIIPFFMAGGFPSSSTNRFIP